MAMGHRRREEQGELFIATQNLAQPKGHVFYDKLNRLLAEAGFDDFVEAACVSYYKEDGPGRPSIPPGVYFRMLFVGYFEGIDSQRGIAWRCHDSLSLRSFLGVPLNKQTPDHSTLSGTRDRLPQEVHDKVFQFVLKLADLKKLLGAKTVGVDSTYLEANAAMKSIVRKDSGEDYQEFLKRLIQEQEGVENPSKEDLQRFDRKRKGKKCSNKEWQSKTDPESQIIKMKDGRTHLAYKAEHVVDLESEFVLAAEIGPATAGDADTIPDSLINAQVHLDAAAALRPEPRGRADRGGGGRQGVSQGQHVGVVGQLGLSQLHP
jgi:transposase